MLEIKTAYKKNNDIKNYDKETAAVDAIIKDVRVRGDAALFAYAKEFDKADVNKDTIKVTDHEIAKAYDSVDPDLLKTLLKCKTNILKYHERQLSAGEFDGSTGWKFAPVKRAGLYVPGGLASYPSSVLMCALPAVAAGVSDIAVASPNVKNPLILAAAKICGINKIYKIGGAHAIAALAYGTESVEKVDVIAGPGNIYVTLAKRRVFGDVGIDMLAGPSEIALIADETADADYIIADLLSQAEHGANGEFVLITTSAGLAARVAGELRAAAGRTDRHDITEASVDKGCQIILVKDIKRAVSVANEVAAEHLEICTANAYEVSKGIYNAGAIFIGHHTPVAAGDYFAGPSHVLPTNGNSRFSSVLSVDAFLKRISLIGYGEKQLEDAADDIIRMAETEGFFAHADSVRVRLKNYNKHK
ncbi:MAG: histidinol dehydrogenase [Clostridiales bacterium]|jgi:histidinol dehydrogenase|nr:histidinol dehydrogenase [Clostridiales bacterium]